MPENERPWGYYEVLLEESTYKLKRITVCAGKRLSLQYHNRRREHWFIVAGQGVARRGDEDIPVSPGVALDIPQGAVHRIENTGGTDLVFIEVQQGDYFGEDDIVRIEDDFGRT
ncbi:phosphomannose isomerase type II C-terminal cupin domain [bacterium]|nr:phosphomannose isomerase type II C-terminal cupin domain [bacterium]